MAEARKRKPTTTPSPEVTGKPVSKKDLIGQIIKRKTISKLKLPTLWLFIVNSSLFFFLSDSYLD